MSIRITVFALMMSLARHAAAESIDTSKIDINVVFTAADGKQKTYYLVPRPPTPEEIKLGVKRKPGEFSPSGYSCAISTELIQGPVSFVLLTCADSTFHLSKLIRACIDNSAQEAILKNTSPAGMALKSSKDTGEVMFMLRCYASK